MYDGTINISLLKEQLSIYGAKLRVGEFPVVSLYGYYTDTEAIITAARKDNGPYYKDVGSGLAIKGFNEKFLGKQVTVNYSNALYTKGEKERILEITPCNSFIDIEGETITQNGCLIVVTGQDGFITNKNFNGILDLSIKLSENQQYKQRIRFNFDY